MAASTAAFIAALMAAFLPSACGCSQGITIT
jgi:hypothetical protein